MKNVFLLMIIFWCMAISLVAQRSEDRVDSIVYITNNDKARLIDKKAKFVFKTSPLAIEAKVAKDVSIIPTIDIRYKIPISIESRYYYKMRKRIKEGLQSNNISGPYISIFGSGGTRRKIVENQVADRGYRVGLKIGQQQRVLNYEYYDIGLRLGHTHNELKNSNSNSFDGISFGFYANYGFVIGKKHVIDPASTCAYMMCHRNRKSALKVNLSNLFYFSKTFGNDNINGTWFFYIRPNISYEHKIADSSFSIEQEINALIGFGNAPLFLILNEIVSTQFSNRFTYKLGGKYYFKMKQRILEGKSGNNLSGIYINCRINHTEQKDRRDGFLEAGVGYQKELYGNIFLDCGAFLKIRTYGEKSDFINFLSPVGIDFRISYVLN